MGFETSKATDELIKKGAKMPPYGPEPFCGIGKGLCSLHSEKKEQQLMELY